LRSKWSSSPFCYLPRSKDRWKILKAALIHANKRKIVIVDQSAGYGTGAHKEQVLVSMWQSMYA
jgi:hypothetical protein